MAVTRLGLSGTSRGLYGSFAGRTEEAISRSTVTRLGLSATPRGLYGTFSGRTLETDTGNNWWFMAKRRSRR